MALYTGLYTDFLYQVGSRDIPPTRINLVHLSDALCQGTNHVCRMMQVAGLLLIEFGHR